MTKLIGKIIAVKNGELPMPPIAKLLNIRLTEVANGKVTMQMPVDGRYANPVGTLHGGVICDLADAVMGTAFATTCEEGDSYTTVELKCNFLRPVWESILTANAWVVYRGRTMGLVECEVVDDRKRLIAKLSSTLTVLHGNAVKGRELSLKR